MDFLPVSDNAARQAIDAATVFAEHRRVHEQGRAFRGGMYWKRQGAYEYLVRTAPNKRQTRVGARNPETEEAYAGFTQGKAAWEARQQALRGALREAERLNKALKVGRAPALLIGVLEALAEAGLTGHFTVVGTHALYAYEMAAGVRIAPGALATQDIDLLWDARRRVQFLADIDRLDTSMLRVLQRADPSFQRKQGHNETAINDRGFEVDFLRRVAESGDPHPFRFSDDEDDLWPVQAERAAFLTSAPRFEHIVMSATGRMAHMVTIAPTAFVGFKRWMAAQARQREAPKRRRDERQADIVQAMLDQGLLQDQ